MGLRLVPGGVGGLMLGGGCGGSDLAPHSGEEEGGSGGSDVVEGGRKESTGGVDGLADGFGEFGHVESDDDLTAGSASGGASCRAAQPASEHNSSSNAKDFAIHGLPP